MSRDECKRDLEAKVKVIISEDKIEAYVRVLEDISECEMKDIVELLNRHNVVYGIDFTRITVLLNEHDFYHDVLVAKGVPVVEGMNGFFKYYFNTKPITQPIILEDGTVDYNTLGKLELCKENDLLVEYYSAVQGTSGVSVTGAVLKPAPVFDLKPLKGKGFSLNEDGTCYYSDFDGKIDFDGMSLKISQIYVVDGDLDANSKPVRFCGDVLIQGNVFGEAKIEASGNITVNGSVESATLVSGKNVLLRNGMQGNNKGCIYAKGEVSAKFFEQTTVVANGDISANSILNCNVNSNGKVIVNGKHGAIIGGKCSAIELISASVIGNTAEISTKVVVGMGREFYELITELDDKITDLKAQIKQLESKLESVSQQLKIKPNDFLYSLRNDIIKEKVENTARYNEKCKQKEELISQKERSLGGRIVVSGRVFPNSNICINGTASTLRDIFKNVTLVMKDNEIKVYSNIRGVCINE